MTKSRFLFRSFNITAEKKNTFFTEIFLYRWYWDMIGPILAIVLEFCPPKAMPI